jgi:hypothetical protein
MQTEGFSGSARAKTNFLRRIQALSQNCKKEKATISFVMSVRPSVRPSIRMKQLGSQWTNFFMKFDI